MSHVAILLPFLLRDFTRIRNDRTRLVITRTMRVPMVDDSSCDSCEKIRFWGAGESSRIIWGVFYQPMAVADCDSCKKI